MTVYKQRAGIITVLYMIEQKKYGGALMIM